MPAPTWQKPKRLIRRGVDPQQYANSPSRVRKADPVVKVGPKGYIHGWIHVGAPDAGTKVFHPRHGKGVVTSHKDGKVTARFDSGEEHTFTHREKKGRDADFERRPADDLPKNLAATKSDRIAKWDKARENAATGGDAIAATGYVRNRHSAEEKVGAYTADQVDAALDYYAGLGYMGINEDLRDGKLDTSRERDEIDRIDAAMHQSPLTSNILVTRGVKKPAKVFGDSWNDTDVSGMEWTDGGYSSTSTGMGTGKSFFTGSDGAVMRILVPKGTHAVTVSDRGEAEILLDRGARFRVVRDNGLVDGVRHLDVEVVAPSG